MYATQKVNEVHKKGIVLSLLYYSHPRKKKKIVDAVVLFALSDS